MVCLLRAKRLKFENDERDKMNGCIQLQHALHDPERLLDQVPNWFSARVGRGSWKVFDS